jgi:hypothetical protein
LDSQFKEILKALGTDITSLQGINRLPVDVKELIYASLIPPSLFAIYGVDPLTLCNRDGHKTVQFEFPPEKGSVKAYFRRSPEESDPIVYIELSDTRYGQVNFEWAIINDPDSERFHIHKTDKTQFLPPKSEFRNIFEEIRAMQAGLAPGQVRRGLHKFQEVTHLVETLLSKLKIDMIHGDPYAYHNAIELERLGYFYTSGKETMLEIHHEFRPGGKLFRRLDGSTSFRQPGMEKTIRGRSWAIHDGILDQPWFCPSMVKLVGRKARDFTFPDAIYAPREATPNRNPSEGAKKIVSMVLDPFRMALFLEPSLQA